MVQDVAAELGPQIVLPEHPSGVLVEAVHDAGHSDGIKRVADNQRGAPRSIAEVVHVSVAGRGIVAVFPNRFTRFGIESQDGLFPVDAVHGVEASTVDEDRRIAFADVALPELFSGRRRPFR